MIGRVDAAGTVDTTTATVAITGGNPRSVASSDGNTFCIVGSLVGVQAATLGNSIVSNVSTTTANLREVHLPGGQLYLSTGSLSNFRIGAVGSGLPVTSGQTTVTLPGFPVGAPNSSNGFFFADLSATVAGNDTLYVADDGLNQLQKYSLVSGTWTSNGAIAISSARGLTAAVSGTTVTLFATTGSNIVSFTDNTGYNGALSGALTTLVTAATNTAIRGIAFTPIDSLGAANQSDRLGLRESGVGERRRRPRN